MDATPSATFQVGDSTYEVVSTADMDYEEARIVKRLTGKGLGSYEFGLTDGDPDAWFAQVFISLRRTNSRITEQQVNELLAGKKLVAIYKSLQRVEEEEEQIPPASTPPSDAAVSNNGGNGGEKEPESSAETPVESGSQP